MAHSLQVTRSVLIVKPQTLHMSFPPHTSIPGNKKKKGFKTNPEFLDPTFLLKKSFLQFVKNYSSKLLKTYGEHCPVVSQVSEKQDKSE